MQHPHDTPALIKPEPLLHIVAVDRSQLEVIQRLNRVIFDEERVINTFEREDLLMLLAYLGDEPVGFKIGYKESKHTFYSAKG
ncbi:MAG: N-acetyltransferase, partial [Rhodothermales bacterium]